MLDEQRCQLSAANLGQSHFLARIKSGWSDRVHKIRHASQAEELQVAELQAAAVASRKLAAWICVVAALARSPASSPASNPQPAQLHDAQK